LPCAHCTIQLIQLFFTAPCPRAGDACSAPHKVHKPQASPTSTTKTRLPHDVYGCSTQHTSRRQERPASIIVVNAGSVGIGMVSLRTPCSISFTHVMLFIILLHNLLSSLASSLLGSVQEWTSKSHALLGNRNCCLKMWCPFDSTCILGVL
jgi:hypothetical protein